MDLINKIDLYSRTESFEPYIDFKDSDEQLPDQLIERIDYNQNRQIKRPPNLSEKIDEVIELISENSISRTDINQLTNNQELMLRNLEQLQRDNSVLSAQIEEISTQNLSLKELVKKGSSDKIVRKISFSFLILFFIGFLSYYISDYELIKLIWVKSGLIVSFAIYLIAFFTSKMVAKI